MPIITNSYIKYFFVLGNNPTLSVAEITAVFGVQNIQYQLHLNNLLLINTEKKTKIL